MKPKLPVDWQSVLCCKLSIIWRRVFCIRGYRQLSASMGCCPSCCGDGYNDIDQPNAEVRRQQQLEAAEKRAEQGDKRGLHTSSMSEARRKQQRLEEEERKAAQAGGTGQGLKWQVS